MFRLNCFKVNSLAVYFVLVWRGYSFADGVRLSKANSYQLNKINSKGQAKSPFIWGQWSEQLWGLFWIIQHFKMDLYNVQVEGFQSGPLQCVLCTPLWKSHTGIEVLGIYWLDSQMSKHSLNIEHLTWVSTDSNVVFFTIMAVFLHFSAPYLNW